MNYLKLPIFMALIFYKNMEFQISILQIHQISTLNENQEEEVFGTIQNLL